MKNKETIPSYDINNIADNLNMSDTNSALFKRFMVAAVIDLATFSPEIISKTLGMDTSSQAMLDDTKLITKIADNLDGTNSRQSCVLALVKSNPELITQLIKPISDKIMEQPVVKLGQAGYSFMKEKLFQSNVKNSGKEQTFVGKIKNEQRKAKINSKTI